MNQWRQYAKLIIVCILLATCEIACAATSDCIKAKRISNEAISLMAHTARDESTKLRKLVQDGWQTPYDDLTIIKSFKITECQNSGEHIKIVVIFDVLGRLINAGNPDLVMFKVAPHQERHELHMVNIGGVLKIGDIQSLEPHVMPEYAIQILTEIANNEPSFKTKILSIINELQQINYDY